MSTEQPAFINVKTEASENLFFRRINSSTIAAEAIVSHVFRQEPLTLAEALELQPAIDLVSVIGRHPSLGDIDKPDSLFYEPDFQAIRAQVRGVIIAAE